ncbi:hypothetical protein COOONC_22841 [Cooperia oncophora]
MCKLLLCILALFTPPLAVLFDRGCHRSFWTNCLLTLLFFVPGVIHAFIVILSKKHRHRYDSDHHHHHDHEVVIESNRVQYATQPVVIHTNLHHHHHHDDVIVARPEYLAQGVVTYPPPQAVAAYPPPPLYPNMKDIQVH